MQPTSTLFGAETGAGGEIVIVGLPFDHGSTYNPGCSTAPDTLRLLTRSENLTQGHMWDLSIHSKLFEQLTISDLGNLSYKASQTRGEYFDFVRESIIVLKKENRKILALGGDHLVTLPLVQGIAGVHKHFQVLQIDAHTDYRPVDKSQHPTHATFVHFLLQEEAVARIVQVGVRGYSSELINPPAKLHQCQLDELSSHLIPELPVYLTVDTDGFDPSIAPAVSHPIIGGLQWFDLKRIFCVMRKLGCILISADWTEYNPFYDAKNYLTGHAIASCLLYVISELSISDLTDV